MGTLEALHHGIPMLGLPLFADQGVNMDMYKGLGVAESMDRFALSANSTAKVIREMLDGNK